MRPGSHTQSGFTYVAALIAIVIFGIGLAAVGQASSESGRREREAQLVRDGLGVVAAVRSYYYASPGAVRSLPKTWDDLLEDRRFVAIRRHLRRIPLDPFSWKADWVELRDPDGSFIGIASHSTIESFRTAPIIDGQTSIATGGRYTDWKFKFVADPETP